MQPASTAPTQHRAIEIKIGNVGLVPKLDAIAAAIAAVREAHRNGMPVACWAALHRAQEALAEAILTPGMAGSGLVLNQRSNHAADAESGLINTHTTSPAARHARTSTAAGQCVDLR